MTTPGGTDPTPAPAYDSVEDWVRDWLLVNISRPWGEVGSIRWCWCARWWEHNEAAVRLTALWYAWESARLEQTGMLTWLTHLDHHLHLLCSPDGPFRDCTPPDTDHPARHTPDTFAPVDPAPDGWFDWWTDEP